MIPGQLLPDLIASAAARAPDSIALVTDNQRMTYADLHCELLKFANGVLQRGFSKGDRIAIYLEKRFETVIASFGASQAGMVFVPINPLLKPAQVVHILTDCAVSVLVTSRERATLLSEVLAECPALRLIVVVPSAAGSDSSNTMPWQAVLSDESAAFPAMAQTDLTAIFYTSGSTGHPKGVMLSHRNFVVGAHSVAHYLENTADDCLLAALPLSFDAGFSQLTTGFLVGARIVLLNYLVPRDILLAMTREHVTGLTAVPPLFIQLAQAEWPPGCATSLRYFANTGGHMPLDTLQRLRTKAPGALPFLMYGLTEAFRSSYLPPDQVDRRPDSIGKAIPFARLDVVRADGTSCGTNEPGELVHSGPLVSLGYWNNPAATAERFRPLPVTLAIDAPECGLAVFSGDTVRMDAEGFLYFVGRTDEMIKTSGYRVSPTEIEEVLYATGHVAECAAVGVPHPTLGQSIHVLVHLNGPDPLSPETLKAACRQRLPGYMVPQHIELSASPLPRGPNGKLDRKALQIALQSPALANPINPMPPINPIDPH